ECAVRGGAARLAFQRPCGCATTRARDVTPVDAARARALARALALGRQRHPGAARLRQADGDRLTRGARAVLALANIFHLLADELARDAARRLTGARFSARAF